MKSQIIHELGSKSLLLPQLINEGLEANDKSKYFMTLVQFAKSHSDNPLAEIDSLRKERLLYKIDDPELDEVISNSKKEDALYHIENFAKIINRLSDEITKMIYPLKLQNESAGKAEAYQKRLDSLIDTIKNQPNVTGQVITQIISSDTKYGDTIHALIMELHKELNRLQRQISKESVDGANVYSVSDDDRELIRSFMKGLNRTAVLKFDHPGLETTATRKDRSLLIQNDIGATDAHVLVINVEDLTVHITYTDVHLPRILFFQSLFEKFNLSWSDTTSKSTSFSEEMYHLCVGKYTSESRDDLKDFLEFVGSRIVFLIDWNKARKRLQNFVKKKSCFEILKWAADNDYGHMGFLLMGGERLIYESVELTSKLPLKFGQKFDEMVGQDAAIEFLKLVLKITSTGLLEGKSESLIKTEIRAELSNYSQTTFHSLLEILNQQAVLIFEAATTARECLVNMYTKESKKFLKRSASRVKVWETKADTLLNQVRAMAKHAPELKMFEEIMSYADDSIDSLEEATFLLQILPTKKTPSILINILHDLADCILQCSKEYVKAVENTKYIKNGSSKSEITDFLSSVDSILTLEHKADQIIRDFKSTIVQTDIDFKEYDLLCDIAANIESSSDSIMKSAIEFRDSIFDELIVK